MNDSTVDDEQSVERSRDPTLQMLDLGNAKVETKRFHPIQWLPDSMGELGWGF